MDVYEATKIVLSRVQNLDPENASKVMGLLLIQDHGEKEMIRLAFGPEALLQSVVLKAKKELGISSNNSSTPSTPSSPSPFLSNGNNPLSRQNSSSATSRLTISTRPWSDELGSPGFNSSSSSSMNSSAPPFYAGTTATTTTDLIDELYLQDQISFLNDGGAHRRSFSVNDIYLGSSDDPSGFGWRPCLYYARGYCKNGTTCRFLHGGGVADLSISDTTTAATGSPTNFDMLEQCQELLRFKSASNFPYSPSSLTNKSPSFLLHHQQSDSPRALMIGEEMNKFGRTRLERNDLAINGGLGMMSPGSGSRQIYLTFPADSTFREEDVSNYFSIYGPVQDVRIPYQQKRMFGFVTFIYPETVKLILAKGNPHFVCDARVLVKPYKEKGKIPDKFRKQQMIERGDYSICGSPTGFDLISHDPFDVQIGPRAQEMLWRKRMEEEAIDLQLQGKRLMDLHLLDVKRQNIQRTVVGGGCTGGAGGGGLTSDQLISPKLVQVNGTTVSMAATAIDDKTLEMMKVNVKEKEKENLPSSLIINNSELNPKGEDMESLPSPESLEHNLPDSPFASPKAPGGDFSSEFPLENSPVKNNTLLNIPSSFNSWHFQVPRLSSGNGAIGM